MSSYISEFSFRIKLFVLNGERDWVDKGTGFIKFVTNEDSNNEIFFQLKSETDDSLILYSKIPHVNNLHRQMDSLLLWNDNSKQYALSFENKDNCKDMIYKICEIQEVDPSEYEKESGEINNQDSSADSSSLENNSNEVGWSDLPSCELANISTIVQVFNSAKISPLRKERLATMIEEKNYIHELVELFKICEDLDNQADLLNLYNIIDVIFSLNKYSLYEIMFGDDIIFDIVGILEYNPSKTEPFKHRNHMKSSTIFKDAMPSTNSDVKEKIKKTFLIQYIQDIMLHTPSIFEENLSSLSSFLFFRKIEIINLIQEDSKIIEDLFKHILEEKCFDNNLERVHFLKQLIVFSQSLQPSNKESFMKLLTDNNIMNCVQLLMAKCSLNIQSILIDILFYICEFSASIIRSFLLVSTNIDNDLIFLNVLINLLHQHPNENFAITILNILKLLLDSETMIIKMEKSEFLTFFYKKSFFVLIDPLIVHTSDFDKNITGVEHDLKTANVLDHILMLLNGFIDGHSYHIKNAILNRDIVRRIIHLLKSNQKFLALSSLRFFRKIVSMKEEFYYRFITRENLLEPIVNAYKENGFRYNLIDSAFLDLFEYIKTEDIKCLYALLIEKYREFFESITYISTFKSIISRYDQDIQTTNNKSSSRNITKDSSLSNNSDDQNNDNWYFQDDEDENNDDKNIENSTNGETIEAPVFLNKKRPIDDSDDALMNENLNKKFSSDCNNGFLKKIIISPIRTINSFISTSTLNASSDEGRNGLVDYPDDE